MKRLTYILLLLLLSVTTRGQTLIGYEYWFDTDFPSKVYTAHMQSDISFDADISTFHQGMHYITFRVKDDKGKWSTPLTDRKSTRLNSSHRCTSRMPSSA